jgi:hypothetical protein
VFAGGYKHNVVLLGFVFGKLLNAERCPEDFHSCNPEEVRNWG